MPFWLKPWPHHDVFPPTHSNIWRISVARVEDSMKKEHATLTPASKSLLEFRIRVDAHHIVHLRKRPFFPCLLCSRDFLL